MRFNAGLTVVVGALAMVLTVLAFSGFLILIGGLVTLPYTAFVAHTCSAGTLR